MELNGRKEVGEAALIAGLCALATGVVELCIRRYEKYLEKKAAKEKREKKVAAKAKKKRS